MKKNFRKAIATAVAGLLIAASLTACSSSDSGGSSSESSGASSESSSVQSSASQSVEEPSASSTSSSSDEQEFVSSGETLNIGIQSNIISIPTYYAYEQGYYEELGLDVNLIIFPNGSPENEGLAAEQLDVASNGLASVYSLASGVCDWIGESDSGTITAAVYVRGDSPVLEHKGEIDGKPDMYGSADTLTGLTVLGPTSTMEQWIAAAYFNQFGLTAGVDYEYLNMERATAAQAIIGGEGDVFVATDVDYANMMEEAGFVQVANAIEATDTQFNNGFLARKSILEERYSDVVLFLKAMYKAAEELESDHDLRNEVAYKFYSDNGKESTEDDVATETEIRPFLVPSDFEADDYVLGSGALQVGEFFASIGTIEEDQVSVLEESINPQPLYDALGITVEAATLG